MEYLDTLLENSFIPIYGITFVLSLIKYPKYFDSELKYLPILFVYTLLNELLGVLIKNFGEFSLISKDIYQDYNWLIYNLYMVIFYLYFYYIFHAYVESKKRKKNIFYAGIFFLAICVLNAFIDDFAKIPQVYSYVTGGLVLIYCIVLYFRKFHAIKGDFKYKENILFWLSTGLLVFHLGYLPIKVIRYVYTSQGLAPEPIVKRIHLILILVSYALFIIGFLRMRRPLVKLRN